MTPTRSGSIRLFRLWGIDVHLHWSWFLVAVYSISNRIPNYTSPVWGALEYLALFLIVVMHEFGHALACRQVGGQADQIVLWPLGGVAYVAPPSRPGATLWSIAAGPLVNVALAPISIGVILLANQLGWSTEQPDLYRFIRAVTAVNLGLLCFNLLPIYPLDGGQILRSILWYPLGRGRSLLVATIVGFVGGAALAALALWLRSMWIGLMTLFLFSNCVASFKQAKLVRKLELLPRRREYLCEACQSSPPIGNFWRCPHCGQGTDLFVRQGTCTECGRLIDFIPCVDCGTTHSFVEWVRRVTS
jgi:Zn-dependent protease